MEEVLLSIIIPVYNAELFIKNTLDCIFPQVSNQTELILVNDGSTDATYDVISRYIREHCDDAEKCQTKVTLINQSNGGCSMARNSGLEVCHGQYVTFVDADDVVKGDFVETFIDIIKQNEGFDVCITGVETYNEDGSLYECVRNTNACYGTHESAVNAIVSEKAKLAFSMWCKIISVSFLQKNGIVFDNEAVCMSDGLFYTSIYQHIQTLLLNDYVGYEWRRRPGSISASYYNTTPEIATKYVNECVKIVYSVSSAEDNDEYKKWILKMRKYGFDYAIGKIENSNLTKSEKKKAIERTMFECLDYEVIDNYYNGIAKDLLFRAKKHDSYFYYGLLKDIDLGARNYERVVAAIKRRVIRR